MDALKELLAKVEAGAFDTPPGDARAPRYNQFANHAENALPQDVRACNVLAWEAYTGSINSAKTLHEAVLPGWDWQAWVYAGQMPTAVVDAGPYEIFGLSETPARAWLIAILKALIAETEDDT